MTKYIYLAGPILGCSVDEAKDWRIYVSDEIDNGELDLVCISPLRCEPPVSGVYQGTYNDPKFGSARAIISKNLYDTRACDFVLAYLPKPPEGRHQSFGTLMELAWAHALNKPTVLVSDDPDILGHPVVTGCASWVLEDLSSAVDLLVGILAGYAGGKNV